MILNVGTHPATVIENGVYYFTPSNYPQISARELNSLLEFINYESIYGRQTKIICEDEALLNKIKKVIANPGAVLNLTLPKKIDGCPNCFSKGCLTEFVYHATTLHSTKKILQSGKLLSAVKVYGKTGEELAKEKYDCLWNDPADFFEYIMFTWGNCVVGDYVVMSDNPQQGFTPGIRFYFRYSDLIKHPGHIFDGYHPIKVKDEIILLDYLHSCIITKQFKEQILPYISKELKDKVHFISQEKIDIWEWTKKVYNYIEGINR